MVRGITMGYRWLGKEQDESVAKGRFEAQLDVIEDNEKKTYTLRLLWKDRLKQSGKIFIPAEAIRWAHPTLVELEKKGFKEKLETQVWPP